MYTQEAGVIATTFSAYCPTISQEFDYLRKELIPRYQKYVKKPVIPMSQVWKAMAETGEEFGERAIKEDFLLQYSSKFYDKGFDKLVEVLPLWSELESVMQLHAVLWGFKVYPNYEFRLTRYGTGGDYLPSASAFDGKMRTFTHSEDDLIANKAVVLLKVDEAGNYVRGNPLFSLIHELSHFGLEELARIYQLDFAERERCIDLFCKNAFGVLANGYKLQANGEPRLNDFVNADTIFNMPKTLRTYRNNYPIIQ